MNSKINSSKVDSSSSAPPPTPQATPRRNVESSVQNRFLMALHAAGKSAAEDVQPAVPDTAWRAPGLTPALPGPRPPGTAVPPEPSAGLTALLERVCSAMYVSERSVAHQRAVLRLDQVLPGAAAELLREGAHLTIRLLARTDSSYRSMSQRREALLDTLRGDRRRDVDVIVVRAGEHDEPSAAHG